MYFILLGPFVSACLCLLWLREPIFCLGRNIFFVCSVLSKTRVIAFAVRERSALGPAFVSERIALYTVRDRSAPGAGFFFCLNPVFGVCGPGPFGSGSRVLFKTKYLVYAVRDRLAPGAGFCSKPSL